MRKKAYENEEYMQYFGKYVSQMSVDEVYKPLLVDILMRRAYEFELSPEDMAQDMQSLLDNLEVIEIRELPKRFNNIGGLYNSMAKTITLNARTLNQLQKNIYDPKLYEILTHEVYHALSRDRDGNDRLTSVNKYSGKTNMSLVEAIVEKAADRCVYSRVGSSAPYFHQNAFGYTDITFITDAIAATYGVSERDFLKNAIMGRKRLINFLADKGNESAEETSQFLDSIELNYSKLHAVLYPVRLTKRKNTPEEFAQKIETIKKAMVNLYSWCEYKFAQRIENTPIKGLRMAEYFENEFKYNHNKLTFVMESALYKFSNKYNRPDINLDVTRKIEPARIETTDRINDIDTIIKNHNKMSYPDAIALINESRHGKLGNYPQFLQRNGIYLSRTKIFHESSRTVNEYMYQDFDNSFWENDLISEYMAFELPQLVKGGNKVLNAIKMMLPFRRINKMMLPEGREIEPSEQYEQEHESGQESFGTLPKEQRDKINKLARKEARKPKTREEKNVDRQFDEK